MNSFYHCIMRKIAWIFFFFHLLLNGFSQNSASILKTITPNRDVKIEYFVLRQDTSMKHGAFRYYFRGNLLVEGKYHANKKHGKWIRKYMAGKIMIEANYLHNEPHGPWNYYFPNGQKQAEITFVRGKKHGSWKGYHINGQILSVFNYDHDTLSGLQTRFYPPNKTEDGAPLPCKKEEVFIRGNHPNYSADIKEYYNNGKLHSDNKMINNEYDGLQTTYYKSGIIWMKVRYDKGKLISIYDWNYPVGKDAFKGSFRGGEGELFYYNYNGELALKAHYHDGLMHGRFLSYSNNQVVKDGFFSNGKRTGTWRQYETRSSKHELETEITFLSDDSSYTIDWFGEGKARAEFYAYKGREFGVVKKFDLNNNLLSETNFYKGIKHGAHIGYRNNLLNEQGNYSFGLKTGNWSYYNDFGKVIYTESFENNVTINEQYFEGDSMNLMDHVEHNFYQSAADYKWKYNSLSMNREYQVHLVHYTEQKNLIEEPTSMELINEIESEYDNLDFLYNPILVPFEVEKRPEVREDYDAGLIFNSLNLRKLKSKSDQTDPKVGVMSIVLTFDEFGHVSNVKLARGIDLEWDQKVVNLIQSSYNFWENAWLLGVPIELKMEIKIPIEYRMIKRYR